MSSTESLFSHNTASTIYALATAAGKSGVAIIRLSGPQALNALQILTGAIGVAPRQAHYLTFSTAGEIIDRGLGLYFPKPHSFTGEEVVEFHVHGSPAVIRQLLDALAHIPGLQPAEAGEFTRRAFLNGKMDLMEAEGLADLIDAETRQQKLQALRQMQGHMSKAYDELRLGIIDCLALLEAYIDFPDEEIPESVLIALEASIMGLRGSITAMLGDEGRGERLRSGIHVVILGAPNAGKSSLFNMIAKRDVAIVSQIPGTTRDMLEIHLDMAGYPVIITDTAGLRESHDEIEREGIRRALERSSAADIKLVLFDGTLSPQTDSQTHAQLDAQAIAVITKCDLLPERFLPPTLTNPFYISTKTGEGVDALIQHIEKLIVNDYSSHSAPFITRSRHRAFLMDSLKSLEKSTTNIELELRCEELRQAAVSLGKITGKIQVDDVLDVIFRRFCIGK